MYHDLKTWPEPFELVKTGKKRFEYRKADRPYKIGDTLHLMEYDPVTAKYTGRELFMPVRYVLHGGCFGIPEDYCIMSL